MVSPLWYFFRIKNIYISLVFILFPGTERYKSFEISRAERAKLSFVLLTRWLWKGLESFWVGELRLFRWLSGKESSCHCRRRDVGDLGLIPGSEIAPREGNGNPVQVSCLGSSVDRVAWRATVHGVTKSSHDSETVVWTCVGVWNSALTHPCLACASLTSGCSWIMSFYNRLLI